jgi:hypothetical protein
MTKTLEMIFKNASGSEVTLRLAEPKDGLTLAEAMTVMQAIVTKNIFYNKGGDLVQGITARISSKDAVELV